MAALAIGASAAWAYALLERTPAWEPWLRPLILLAGAAGALGVILAPALGRLGRRIGIAAALLGVLAAMAGPVAYAADTITTAHSGSIPSAGPASAAGGGMGTGAPGAGGGTHPTGLPGGGGSGGRARSGAPGAAGTRPTAPPGSSSGAPGGVAGHRPSGAPAGGAMAAQTSAALVKALRSDAGAYRWAAATSGSQSAATLELASDEAVMAIGGFDNQGGNLGLDEFERYVDRGEIHYYIASTGGGGGPGGGGSDSTIATWVKAHFTAETIGGQTVYDLARAT
jgi:hypothetical protein